MSDYAEHCTKVDTLRRIVHDACLKGEWEEVKRLSELLITQSVEIKMFADEKLEERMRKGKRIMSTFDEYEVRERLRKTRINLDAT